MQKREIRIATPCEVDWESMTPADKGRFCGECKKVVRNLSQMSEREALQMLTEENNGQLCVRFLYDKHGKVFFAGDRQRLIPATLLSKTKRAALAAAAIAVPLALNACNLPEALSDFASSTEVEDDELMPMQGGMMPNPDWHPPTPEADAASDASTKEDATPIELEADGGPANDAGDAGDAEIIPIN